MLLRSNGFTLIELIIVVVLIAILAVIAVPRFINLGTTAKQNSTNSLAAALAAASANNYAIRSADATQGSTISNCQNISALLPSSLPAGYSITATAISSGSSVSCTLTGLSGTSATFVGLGIN